MKTEVREAARSYMENLLVSIPANLIPIRVSTSNGYAVDTGTVDPDTSTPVYAYFTIHVPPTTASSDGRISAFNLEVAMQDRIEYDSERKKERKTVMEDPEKAAKAAARLEQQNALEAWLITNLNETMTTTEIQQSVPELADVSIMQVGTFLKTIAEKNPAIQRDVIKGKPYYSKA